MNRPARTDHHEDQRFPVEIISCGVWLYYRFWLTYRDEEGLLHAVGDHYRLAEKL